MELFPYDRAAAVRYAHRWAFARNPRYYDYELLGGDCTNFASQCLYAGAHVMDYTPTFGWYYADANDKAPAWTGVPYLYNYLTRSHTAPGPAARDGAIDDLLPGDVVQLSFDLPVRRIHTAPQVLDCVGKAALARGPLIYCFEETDQTLPVFSLVLPADAEIQEYRGIQGLPEYMIGLRIFVEGKSKQTDAITELDPVSSALTAIPYFAWSNREKGDMAVWIKEA